MSRRAFCFYKGDNVKKFIIGFIVGSLLGGGIAYAATRNIILQSADGIAISAANPLYIQLN